MRTSWSEKGEKKRGPARAFLGRDQLGPAQNGGEEEERHAGRSVVSKKEKKKDDSSWAAEGEGKEKRRVTPLSNQRERKFERSVRSKGGGGGRKKASRFHVERGKRGRKKESRLPFLLQLSWGSEENKTREAN